MNKRYRAVLLMSAVLTIGLSGGCGDSASFFELNADYGDMAGFMAWGESEHMNYEVPDCKPNVLVDQSGYQRGCRKTVLFVGEELGSTYRIIDEKTGIAVYEGQIEVRGYDAASGTEISYGNFTEFDTPGSYYIETAVIGRSYPFQIGDDIYAGIFERAYQELLTEQGTWTGGERCYVLAALLTSYELYPHIYAGDGDGNGIADVLDFSCGQMRHLMGQEEADPGTMTPEAAMVLAQFSRIFQYYDKAFSDECLRSAETFWAAEQKASEGRERKQEGQSEKQGSEAGKYSSGRMYLAEAQLYRSTGSSKYHEKVTAYLENNADDLENGMRTFADVAYLSTESAVELELCQRLMTAHMEAAEGFAEEAQGQMFMIAGESREGMADQLLFNMVELAFVDYVITNHEYANVMENHLHYFLGRNPQAVSYLAGFGDEDSSKETNILSHPVNHADFIFMMSAVMNHQTDSGIEQ